MTTANPEERIGKIETDVAVINTKIDGISQSLHGINASLEKQTEILGRFLAYQQRQDHLEEKVGELVKDYRESKERLTAGMGWLKGAIAVGTIALAVGQGIGAYLVKEKVGLLEDLQGKVNRIEVILSGGTLQR